MAAWCRTSGARLLRPGLSHTCYWRLLRSNPQVTPYSYSQGAIFSSQATRSYTNTVDANEVNHFNALASTWWDPQGPSRLLHLMNPLRHSFIQSCLSSQPDAVDAGRGFNYLDVGCGGGIFAESAARRSRTSTVTAIDPSRDVLKVAEAHARKDPMLSQQQQLGGQASQGWKIRYLNLGIEDLPLPGAGQAKQDNSYPPNEGYDMVTVFEVLEHVSHPSAFLSSLLPHVRPGGWIVLSTIARTWTSWVTTKVVAEDVLRIVPQGTHDWNKYINESELRQWFAEREAKGQGRWANARAMGVVYVPGVGWREIRGAEDWGNYFFGIRKAVE